MLLHGGGGWLPPHAGDEMYAPRLPNGCQWIHLAFQWMMMAHDVHLTLRELQRTKTEKNTTHVHRTTHRTDQPTDRPAAAVSFVIHIVSPKIIVWFDDNIVASPPPPLSWDAISAGTQMCCDRHRQPTQQTAHTQIGIKYSDFIN